jgi:hypothetical protein
LLWFDLGTEAHAPESSASELLTLCDRYPDLAKVPKWEAFNRGDRMSWVAVSVVSAVIVWATDLSALSAFSWLLMTLFIGQVLLPKLCRTVQVAMENRESFFRDVAFGWALGSGAPVGVLLGVLLAFVFGWPVSAVLWGLVGLLVGPLVAAIQGVTLAALIVGIVWLVTGTNLAQLEQRQR